MLEELELANTPKLLPDGGGRSSENLDSNPGAAYDVKIAGNKEYSEKTGI